MNKHLVLAIASLTLTASPALAGDIFSRIDSTLSKVERSMDSTDRALNRTDRVKDRVADKIPEGTAPAQGQRQVYRQNQDQPLTAQEIEDRQILREAEAIKSRRRSGR